MSDLISRQAAIDAFLTELTKRERKNLLHTWSTVEVKYFVVDMLEKSPCAQPERKKGKWIRHDEIKNVYGGIYIECSECGEKYVVQHILDEKYCRNCGAKMEVGENAD